MFFKEIYVLLKLKLESKILENILILDNGGWNSDGDDFKFFDFFRKENNFFVFILFGDEVVVWDDIEFKFFFIGCLLIFNNDNEVLDVDKDVEKKLWFFNMFIDVVFKEDDNRKNLILLIGIFIWIEILWLEKIVNMLYRYFNDKLRVNSFFEEFGGYVEWDVDFLDFKIDYEDREFSNKELCVVENVCYVVFIDNDC